VSCAPRRSKRQCLGDCAAAVPGSSRGDPLRCCTQARHGRRRPLGPAAASGGPFATAALKGTGAKRRCLLVGTLATSCPSSRSRDGGRTGGGKHGHLRTAVRGSVRRRAADSAPALAHGGRHEGVWAGGHATCNAALEGDLPLDTERAAWAACDTASAARPAGTGGDPTPPAGQRRSVSRRRRVKVAPSGAGGLDAGRPRWPPAAPMGWSPVS